MENDFSGSTRRQLKKLKLEEIEYTPLMFNLSANLTEDQALIEDIDTTLNSHTGNITLVVKDGGKE